MSRDGEPGGGSGARGAAGKGRGRQRGAEARAGWQMPWRAPPRCTHLRPPWGAGTQARESGEACPEGLQLDALQMWAGEGRRPPDVGIFGSLGAPLRPPPPPPVSELGSGSEFGGWGGEEAAGTGEGAPQSPGFPFGPPLLSWQGILGPDPRPPPTWSLRLRFLLTQREMGGGETRS